MEKKKISIYSWITYWCPTGHFFSEIHIYWPKTPQRADLAVEGANCYCSLCPHQGAQLCSTTANHDPLLARFPWKLQRTLLILGCKQCKDSGKAFLVTAEACRLQALPTAFFSARRCLVSEKLKTLMAGYTRLLNDFPSCSQLSRFHGTKLPWPKARLVHANFNCALSNAQLCCLTNCSLCAWKSKVEMHTPRNGLH